MSVNPLGAQGAALAIENAAVMGGSLSNISDLSEVPGALHTYETWRLQRPQEITPWGRHSWSHAELRHLYCSVSSHITELTGNILSNHLTLKVRPHEWHPHRPTENPLSPVPQCLFDDDVGIDG
ncbi:hypothetical protein K438DRAFT_1790934 [Mycena galopus ATCC 62051]|nr:hypothetical protein K438DRAFT_1790934 [Mycena galopus ATCC 62051]